MMCAIPIQEFELFHNMQRDHCNFCQTVRYATKSVTATLFTTKPCKVSCSIHSKYQLLCSLQNLVTYHVRSTPSISCSVNYKTCNVSCSIHSKYKLLLPSVSSLALTPYLPRSVVRLHYLVVSAVRLVLGWLHASY